MATQSQSENYLKIKIGSRISFLKKSKKYSQEKLALTADLDRTYINSVENGRRNISIISLEKITNQNFGHQHRLLKKVKLLLA